ncbi:unnamed protein product, partial [Sphenostylis stenocarpa]
NVESLSFSLVPPATSNLLYLEFLSTTSHSSLPFRCFSVESSPFTGYCWKLLDSCFSLTVSCLKFPLAISALKFLAHCFDWPLE